MATEVQGFPTGLECGQVWASARGSYGKARTASTGWERLGRWLDMAREASAPAFKVYKEHWRATLGSSDPPASASLCPHTPALALGGHLPAPSTGSSGQEQCCGPTALPNEDSQNWSWHSREECCPQPRQAQAPRTSG